MICFCKSPYQGQYKFFIVELKNNMSVSLMHGFDEAPSSVNLFALDSSYLTNIRRLKINEVLKDNQKRKRILSKQSQKSSQVSPETSKSMAIMPKIESLNHLVQQNDSKRWRKTNSFVLNTMDQSPKRCQKFEELRFTDDNQFSPFNQLNTANQSFLPEIYEKKQRTPSLLVFYLIRRFATKLSAARKLKLFFKSHHFKILGDNATDTASSRLEIYKTTKTSKFCGRQVNLWIKKYKSKFNSYSSRVLRMVPLIYPQSITKITLDLIHAFIIVYFLILIPIQISFGNNIVFSVQPISYSFMIFLIFDMILKLDTVHYGYGKPITDREQILKIYLKGNFLIDSISLIVIWTCYLNQAYQSYTRWFDLILLLFFSKLPQLEEIINHSQEYLNLSKTTSSILELMKLALTILFSEHIFSCLWYWIADFKLSQNETNWLSQQHIEKEDWMIKYLNSFYFSTVTMLSVGYGDIVPTSKALYQLDSLEKTISILFMLFACIQLSYTVNTVGTIISNMKSQQQYITKRLRIINQYMNNNHLSFDLKYQVREYLKIFWQRKHEINIKQEEQILSSLPEGLKKKIIFESCNKVISQIPLFQNHFSHLTKQKLLLSMRQIVLNPETIITSQPPGLYEPCLCFVQSGYLEAVLNQSPCKELGQLQPGTYFGQEQFLTGESPKVSYSAQSFVKLIIIQRSDFLSIIKENPQDYEEYCMLKDQLQLRNYDQNQQKGICLSCKCQGHEIFNCPIIHYVVDREKVIKQYQYSNSQQRQQFKRSSIKSDFSTLQDQSALQELSVNILDLDDTKIGLYQRMNQLNPLTLRVVPPTHSTQRARRNFQYIVKKVLKIHSMSRQARKLLKLKQPKFFQINQSHQIFLLKQIIEDPNQRRFFTQKEFTDVTFLVMKNNLRFETEKFETQKDFEIYLPHNNLENILNYLDISPLENMLSLHLISSKKVITERTEQLKSSLIRYMLFPQVYFERFCSKSEINRQIKKFEKSRQSKERKPFLTKRKQSIFSRSGTQQKSDL